MLPVWWDVSAQLGAWLSLHLASQKGLKKTNKEHNRLPYKVLKALCHGVIPKKQQQQTTCDCLWPALTSLWLFGYWEPKKNMLYSTTHTVSVLCHYWAIDFSFSYKTRNCMLLKVTWMEIKDKYFTPAKKIFLFMPRLWHDSGEILKNWSVYLSSTFWTLSLEAWNIEHTVLFKTTTSDYLEEAFFCKSVSR